MDNINQVGKGLGKSADESDLNIRRVKENFPQIEKVVDRLNPTQTFTHNFTLSNHPHRVKVNFYFSEPDKDCHPEPIDILAIADGDCPEFSVNPTIASYPPGRFSQIGGFTTLYPAPGITVPISGYYLITFKNGPAGVTLGSGSYVLAGILVNGGVVIESIYGATSGGLAFFSPNIELTTVAYIAGGSVVAGFMEPHDIAFWTPSDICGFTGGQDTRIELVGAA